MIIEIEPNYHVYGITRRRFGNSTHPLSAYGADRLGDDTLAVIEALKLNRPVLAGHFIAEEELSSIGSRRPEQVAGLIYLDAGAAYAYHDRSRGDLLIDLLDLRRQLDQLAPGGKCGPDTPTDPRPLMQELLKASASVRKGSPRGAEEHRDSSSRMLRCSFRVPLARSFHGAPRTEACPPNCPLKTLRNARPLAAKAVHAQRKMNSLRVGALLYNQRGR